MTYLSIVIPAYNEEAMIPQAAEALDVVLSSAGINYQILFVDDGSSDHTWNEVVTMAKTDARIMGIRFSRNFGKESAILAGLAKATGDVVAVMDCDLQHPPETLIEMYQKWKEGYQVIEGIKTTRGKESALHSKCARLFYHIMSKSTGYDMENTSDFKMLDRKAVDSILSMPERNMFFRAASSWVGYKTTSVEFEVQERVAGTSKWSPWSLFKYAFRNIAAFTTAPLQIVTISGCVCFLCSLILMIYSLMRYFTGHAVEGYTTILLILLFIGSAIMISLGIIVYYVAKIYEEVKKRPRYIISQEIQKNKGESNAENN